MKKFFIVGCPRSGTTMVQQALNRHSQIVIPPETKFFFAFIGQSHKQQLRHITRLETDLKIDLPRPATAIRSLADGRAYYDEIAQLYSERLGRRDVGWFGEKTPEHTGRLPRIQQMFPEAKIVVLQRDGRDVAASLSKMPWTSSDLYVNFMIWLYYNRILQDAKIHQCPNVYFARYENIVDDPEREFDKILDFLDLPYEAAVAEGSGNREGVPQREYAWKGRALQKITGNRVGAFCATLTSDQIEILERLGRNVLPSLGYDLLTDGQRRLSFRFLLNLSLETAKFVYRLPWHAVAQEMLDRCWPESAPEPLPAPMERPLAIEHFAALSRTPYYDLLSSAKV